MNARPKVAIFITARMASTRLPKKMVLAIRNKRVIEHDIDRAKLVVGADMIVLCTSNRAEDAILEKIALKNGIKCFRGSSEDKLARWLGAANKFKVDYFVTFDGDDLFCDPLLMGMAIKQMKRYPCDFLRGPKDLASGAFTYCISVSALKKVCEIKGTDNTEMQWVYFTDTGLFKIRELKVSDVIYHNEKVRMTLDYPEDLAFFRQVFNELNMNVNSVPLRDILKLLKVRPDLIKINFFRQNDFLQNQKNKTKLVLKHDKNKTK